MCLFCLCIFLSTKLQFHKVWGYFLCLLLTNFYWVGQRVHLGFSHHLTEKPKLLANPIFSRNLELRIRDDVSLY